MEFILQKEGYFGYKIGGNNFFNGGKTELFKLGLCVAPILVLREGSIGFQIRGEVLIIFNIFRRGQCNLLQFQKVNLTKNQILTHKTIVSLGFLHSQMTYQVIPLLFYKANTRNIIRCFSRSPQQHFAYFTLRSLISNFPINVLHKCIG